MGPKTAVSQQTRQNRKPPSQARKTSLITSKEESKKPIKSTRKPGLPPTSSGKIQTQRKGPPSKLAKSVSDFKEVVRPQTTTVDHAAASETPQATEEPANFMTEVAQSTVDVQQTVNDNLSQGPTEEIEIEVDEDADYSDNYDDDEEDKAVDQ